MPRKLNQIEMSNWTMFHKSGGHNLSRCKLGHFTPARSETVEHNAMVSEICTMLLLNDVLYITECVSNKNTKRRYDIVMLSFDIPIIVEIEVTGSIKLDADITVYRRKSEWKVIYKNEEYRDIWKQLLAVYAQKHLLLTNPMEESFVQESVIANINQN